MKPEDFWVRNEFGTDRISLEEAHALPRLPVYAVLDNIRSAHNVGSMFRTADGAALSELLLCGYSPTPPHRHLSKTALGAVEVVPWRHCTSVEEAIGAMRTQQMHVLALEYTIDSTPLSEYHLQFPLALVMGNEAEGLSDQTRGLCDATVHLPMHGLKNSLNVSVAFGIAVYEVLRRYSLEYSSLGRSGSVN